MDNPDFYPETNYDPSSGEYSSEADFEPQFEVTIWLDAAQTISITVKSFSPDTVPTAAGLLAGIQNLQAKGTFEPGFDPANPQGYGSLPDGFDVGGKNSRGPFPDADSVEAFLKKSGLKGVATVYYDEANDEFWADVDTSRR